MLGKIAASFFVLFLVLMPAKKSQAEVVLLDFGSPQFVSDTAAIPAATSQTFQIASGLFDQVTLSATAFYGVMSASFNFASLRCEAETESQGQCKWGLRAASSFWLHDFEALAQSDRGGSIFELQKNGVSIWSSPGAQQAGPFRIAMYADKEPIYLGIGDVLDILGTGARGSKQSLSEIGLVVSPASSPISVAASAPIPEPGSGALVILALLGLCATRKISE